MKPKIDWIYDVPTKEQELNSNLTKEDLKLGIEKSKQSFLKLTYPDNSVYYFFGYELGNYSYSSDLDLLVISGHENVWLVKDGKEMFSMFTR